MANFELVLVKEAESDLQAIYKDGLKIGAKRKHIFIMTLF